MLNHTSRTKHAQGRTPFPRHFRSTLIFAAAMLGLLISAQPLWAGFTITDDVSPSDSSNWAYSTLAYIGNSNNGSILVDGGTHVTSGLGFLGYSTGAHGIATITGTDSIWNSNSSIIVGYNGTGYLHATGGGKVASSNLTVGMYNNGELKIENGGKVQNSGSGKIGSGAGMTGLVTVTGAGSEWSIDDELTVGNSGNATLNILDGAVVSNDQIALLGSASGSKGIANVSGVGSKWAIGNLLRLGCSGTGELYISEGGLVTVAKPLWMDECSSGNSFIQMSTGGQLALYGGNASGSINDFLSLMEGPDRITIWSDAQNDWIPIQNAVLGTDCTLEYLNIEGTNYTKLTVGTVSDVPEPSTCLLLLTILMTFGGAFCVRKRR